MGSNDRLHDVDIRVMADGHAEVLVDGREMRGVCGVKVLAQAGTVPLLTLDFAARTVNVKVAEAIQEPALRQAQGPLRQTQEPEVEA